MSSPGSADLLTGPLDVPALRAALAAAPGGPARLPIAPVGPAGLAAAVDAERRRVDPGAGPVRAVLLVQATDRHVLVLTAAGDDERAFATLRRAVGDAYHRDGPASAGAQSHLDWWRSRLADISGVLDLPRDRERPPGPGTSWAERRTIVPTTSARGVRELAAALGTDPRTVVLAAYAILLARLTGDRCPVVAVSTPDGSVPVPLPVTAADRFAAHVLSAHTAVVEATAYPDIPVEALVDALGLPRDPARPPLAQVGFRIDPLPWGRLRLPGVDVEPVAAWRPAGPYDLTLTVHDRPDPLALTAHHRADLYRPDRIDALLASLRTLLDDLLRHPARAVGAATARPVGSRLPEPAAPLARAVEATGVLERVRLWAARTPHAPAATGVDGPFTHAELNRLRAAVTAAILAAAPGTEPPAPVAVLGTRSATLPAVLLGVLASGSRWLLLDPADRSTRPARQVAAAGARIVLVCPGARLPAGLTALTRVDVADLAPGDPAGPVAPPARRGYLMSTSGTTGEPALIATGEGPLAHFLGWYPQRFGIGARDATALLAGPAHDALLRDCLATLAVGGRVCVPRQELLRDPAGLARWLDGSGVTVLHLTPQLARLLGATAHPLPRLRLVVSAGDDLDSADVRALRAVAPNAELINAYGTTETPQIHAFAAVRPAPAGEGRPVPVGAGAPGSRLLVVGAGGRPAAVGELGEVLVHSRYLAAGYLDAAGRPDPFGPAPTSTDRTDPTDRVFRTGDLGRYDPDGAVVLAGRIDDQVKVRGHRVEPAEVRTVLRAHPDVTDAAVVARPDPTGETGISAYAVPARPDVSVRELREFLADRLPEHARPATLQLVAELPLTAGGKLDRSRLPAPAPVATDEPPATPNEHLVAAVWAEVLGLAAVGATDNFFDLGGHSLSILAVHDRLVARTGPHLPLVDLFRYPTVRALAARLDGARPNPALERAARRVAARAGAGHRTTRGTQDEHTRPVGS